MRNLTRTRARTSRSFFFYTENISKTIENTGIMPQYNTICVHLKLCHELYSIYTSTSIPLIIQNNFSFFCTFITYSLEFISKVFNFKEFLSAVFYALLLISCSTALLSLNLFFKTSRQVGNILVHMYEYVFM